METPLLRRAVSQKADLQPALFLLGRTPSVVIGAAGLLCKQALSGSEQVANRIVGCGWSLQPFRRATPDPKEALAGIHFRRASNGSGPTRRERPGDGVWAW